MNAMSLAGDDDAREDLDALLVTLAHLGVHADAVATLNGGRSFFSWCEVMSLMMGFMTMFLE